MAWQLRKTGDMSLRRGKVLRRISGTVKLVAGVLLAAGLTLQAHAPQDVSGVTPSNSTHSGAHTLRGIVREPVGIVLLGTVLLGGAGFMRKRTA